MHLDFTDEQKMIRDSISRYLADHYSFEARAKLIRAEDDKRVEVWRDLTEMGVWSAAFPEALGGYGGTPSDILAISEEFGKALFVEPFVSSVVLCGQLFREAGGESASSEIKKIIAGESHYSLAYLEPTSGYDPTFVETTAAKSATGYLINGVKTAVLGAPVADKFIISAQVKSGGEHDQTPGLFLVGADMATVESASTSVGLAVGDVILQDVEAPSDALLAQGSEADKLLESALEWGIVALCGEASGLCRRALELTTEYCRTREQFGAPLSKFQALQHKMADMFICTEELVSMSYLAAIKKQENADDKRKAIAAAKAQLGKSCEFVGETSVQLHGGMGMTEEMAIGHYFMHGVALNAMLGDKEYHLARMA